MLDYVTRLLFEDLPLLLVAEVIALGVVLAIHRRRFTAKSRRLVWITIGVCAALIAIQKLTVTKREALKQMVSALAQAVDDGDVSAIGQRLDDEFQDRQWDKKTFLDQVRLRLQRWQIDQASVGGFEIEIDGEQGTVSFRATCDWRSRDRVGYKIWSSWKLRCVRRADGWKVLRIVKGKVGPGGTLDFRDGWRY